MVRAGGVSRRARAGPARTRSARGAARDVPGMGAGRCPGSRPRGARLRRAVVRDGARAGRGVPSLRGARVDAGGLLRDRRRRHRHHREERSQADPPHPRPRPAPLGALRRVGHSSRHGRSPRSSGCSWGPECWRCWSDRRACWSGRTALGLALLPPGLLAGLTGPATSDTLWRIGWYFAEAGAFVFGSGLAIVPFLHGGVVREFGWLSERQFLDAVAVAMITPGPVVITVAFIGYLVAGPAGAVVAALATFLPCYLFTVIPAPHFRRWSRNDHIRAFVEGVTAAATGAIAGAAFVLGRRAIVDLATLAIAAIALLVSWRFRRAPGAPPDTARGNGRGGRQREGIRMRRVLVMALLGSSAFGAAARPGSGSAVGHGAHRATHGC